MIRLPPGSYHHEAWAGVVVPAGPGAGFALRFAVVRDGRRADLSDFAYLVREVGPHAPDSSYSRMGFDTSLPFGEGDATPFVGPDGDADLTVEWSVGDGIVARVQAGFTGHLEVVGYFPWDWGGTWKLADGTLTAWDHDSRFFFAATARVIPPRPIESAVTESALRFPVASGSTLYLSATLAEGSVRGERDANIAIDPDIVDRRLDNARRAYERSRVHTFGPVADLAPAVVNNIHWTILLQPEIPRRYTPAGRRWIFPSPGGGQDHWTMFAWDAFFNALLLGVEHPEAAWDTVAAVLDTQYDNGNIPNWRGRFGGTPDRSQPPVGAFCVWKLFRRTGNRAGLETAFSFLERWTAWWTAPKGNGLRRDPRGRGLCAWGSDTALLAATPPRWERGATGRQRAAWESGQDDLPNWDDAPWDPAAETLAMDVVDLNALLALDYECLALIAERLGNLGRADTYRRRYATLRDRVNDTLWDESRGCYADRRWDGALSPRLAASNFFPLVAGIPSDARAARMLDLLRDDAAFGGRYVVPTIHRQDPAFSDQQYWRGSIWPPTNYLVYHGLRRYGATCRDPDLAARFTQTAADLADRSANLFLAPWRRYQHCRENYDARTGEGGGHRFQSWGPLLVLTGLEEFLDVSPWEGMRLGTPAIPRSRGGVRRLTADGHRWDIETDPDNVRVSIDDRLTLTAPSGTVLRQVRVTSDFSAEVTTSRPGGIRFQGPGGVHEIPARVGRRTVRFRL